MDLVRAWAAAIAVFVIGSLATFVLALEFSTAAAVTKGARSIFWAALPALVIYALMAIAAAGSHPKARRSETRRHAVAVLAVPVAALAATLVSDLARGAPVGGTIAALVAGAAGTFLGWRAAAALPGRRRDGTKTEYF
jgi:hypothetical protein